MSQLTQELQFYTNVYKRLSKELRRWEDGIRECLLNMNAMYTDRNQHHDAISGMFSHMHLNQPFFTVLVSDIRIVMKNAA
jgi:hypothetical protein